MLGVLIVLSFVENILNYARYDDYEPLYLSFEIDDIDDQNGQPSFSLDCVVENYDYHGEYLGEKTCQFATKNNIMQNFDNILRFPQYNGYVNILRFKNSDIKELQYGVFDQRENNNHLTELSFTNVNMETMETNALSSLKALEYLYIDQNKISKIRPGVFSGLPNLKLLNMSHNMLSGLLDKRNFTGIGIQLETLDLSYNQIKYLRKNCLEGFNQLVTFNISHNQLIIIPSFYENSALEYAILSFNNISEIPENTFPLKSSISSIDLSYNNLSTVSNSSGMNGYQRILSLNLNNNFVIDISDILKNIRVNQLSLENNPIDSIDGGFFCSELIVSNLNLKTLTNISMCNSGTVIKASNNNLQDIPMWTETQAVEIVELQNNKISAIPLGRFSDFKSLSVLRLDQNKIEYLETGAFSGLRVLKSLNLSFNALSTIDHHGLFGMKQLEDLYLGGNMLTTLPYNDLFSILPGLKNLGLNRNHWYCTKLMAILQAMHIRGIENVHHGEVHYHVANLDGILCWPENRTSVVADKATAGSIKIMEVTKSTILTTTPKKISTMPTLNTTTSKSTTISVSTLSTNITSTLSPAVLTNPTAPSKIASSNPKTHSSTVYAIDHFKDAEKLMQNHSPTSADQSSKKLDERLNKIQNGMLEVKNLFVIIVILLCCAMCVLIYKFYHNIKKRTQIISMNSSQQPLATEIEM